MIFDQNSKTNFGVNNVRKIKRSEFGKIIKNCIVMGFLR